MSRLWRFCRAMKADIAAMRERSRHQPYGGHKIDFAAVDEMSPIDPEHIDKILNVIAADYNVPVWRLRGESSPKSSTPEPGQYKIWFGPQYGAPGRWALCNCDRHGVWSSESGMYMPAPKQSQFENNGG